jgi:hypothetical protein
MSFFCWFAFVPWGASTALKSGNVPPQATRKRGSRNTILAGLVIIKYLLIKFNFVSTHVAFNLNLAMSFLPFGLGMNAPIAE